MKKYRLKRNLVFDDECFAQVEDWVENKTSKTFNDWRGKLFELMEDWEDEGGLWNYEDFGEEQMCEYFEVEFVEVEEEIEEEDRQTFLTSGDTTIYKEDKE